MFPSNQNITNSLQNYQSEWLLKLNEEMSRSGRLPLSVVVSAVTRLNEPTGATMQQVERTVRGSFPASRRAVRVALDRAVTEGFLGLNRRRYLPVCYKCACLGRRRRRDDDLLVDQPPPKAPKYQHSSRPWDLSRVVPAFLGDLFQS